MGLKEENDAKPCTLKGYILYKVSYRLRVGSLKEEG